VARREGQVAAADVHRDRDHVALLALRAGIRLGHSVTLRARGM